MLGWLLRSKLCIIVVILGILSLVSVACTQSPDQAITTTPVEVSKEGRPGDYINVIIQVSSLKPCKLILSTSHRTEVDNYLAPNTSDKLTIPNSDGTVVFHERIPWEAVPGSYILRVIQMRHNGDTEGKEIFSQDFKVK